MVYGNINILISLIIYWTRVTIDKPIIYITTAGNINFIDVHDFPCIGIKINVPFESLLSV